MLHTRLAADRGHADHGWLNARHSFSFSQYYDPEHMGFSALRVINDDQIAAGMGFGMHGHQNMEIITYIIEGELSHRDSLGNKATVLKGQVQKMSAGRGVRHSEYNSSARQTTHLLQIWIEPNLNDIEPEYEQHNVTDLPLTKGWRAIAAPDGLDGAFRLYQDASLWLAHVNDGDMLREYALTAQRCAYVHIVTGGATVNGLALQAGDAVKITDEAQVSVQLLGNAQVLLFDLPV